MRNPDGRSGLLGTLHRAAGHPRLVGVTALLLRARTVTSSAAFVAREATGRGGTFAYRLRDAPHLSVLVRHGRGDAVTLGEVFHERDYEPPAELPAIRPGRIVDLGANVGYFGAFALGRWPGATVTALEPDPENADVHARVIALNGLEDRWELRRAAAATRTGHLRFNASGNALSRVAEAGAVVVAAQDVLGLVAGVDLLKVYIEGGEWEILGDPRWGHDPPSVVVLEYHPEGAAGTDPHALALERLAAVGLTRTTTIFVRDDGYGMLWAWRPDLPA